MKKNYCILTELVSVEERGMFCLHLQNKKLDLERMENSALVTKSSCYPPNGEQSTVQIEIVRRSAWKLFDRSHPGTPRILNLVNKFLKNSIIKYRLFDGRRDFGAIDLQAVMVPANACSVCTKSCRKGA